MKKRSPKVPPQKVAAQPRRSRTKLATAVAVAKPTLSLPIAASTSALASDIGHLIASARRHVAQTANEALTSLYWQIGVRVHRHVLQQKRAEYGGQIVSVLGRELEARYGRGFGEKSLRHMVRFAEAFPDAEIVSAVRRQLSWTHFRQIIYLDDSIKRDFYLEMCRVEGWSTRVLQQKIDSMLFERTALSKKPDHLIRRDLATLREDGTMTPDMVFQDPYMLDFLGLKDTFSEKDLEAALLREIERFILELGAGFAFVERQKRITLDGDDYYIDLLFFHRRLRRLVAIELKIGEFKPAHSGQMGLYLRWLDRHERQPDEQAPVGIILCAGKKRETVEYLDLGKSGIHVAEYLTELPPREVLRERLHQALAIARARLDQRILGASSS